MSALIVTLGDAITSLRRAMAGACPLVDDAANKMTSLSVVGPAAAERRADPLEGHR